MASFEVLKESAMALADKAHHDLKDVPNLSSVYNMISIVIVKLGLLWLCNRGANRRRVYASKKSNVSSSGNPKTTDDDYDDDSSSSHATQKEEQRRLLMQHHHHHHHPTTADPLDTIRSDSAAKHVVQLADPTLEALAQDHWNDCLSNGVAAVALLFAVREPSLWFLDPIGAILISLCECVLW